MRSQPSIQLLSRKEINIEKWDECIRRSSNGLIYGYSFYLDAVCTNWNALIINDYEAVVPLPWRKKFSLRYVYQPTFLQRLSIFGNNVFDVNSIYRQAWKKFSFVHYNVSEKVSSSNVQIKQKQNFIIDLRKSYIGTRQSYSKECLLNIKKAESRGCYFTNKISELEVLHNYQLAYGSKNKNLQAKDYTQFLTLLQEAKKRNMLEISGVKNRVGQTIYSAAILKDSKRVYYILGAPTPEGRQKRATYFFIDQLLQTNSESLLLFDFEGSDIPNVAAFYKRFGPEIENYYEVRTIPPLNRVADCIQR